jgi:hypothetical protein
MYVAAVNIVLQPHWCGTDNAGSAALILGG